jgi:hypothetical protein
MRKRERNSESESERKSSSDLKVSNQKQEFCTDLKSLNSR